MTEVEPVLWNSPDTGTRETAASIHPRMDRAFWGVMAAFMVHGLVVSTWVSRIPSLKSRLQLGDGAFGLALLGMAIGSVAAIPICGALVTRYGSRRMAQWTATGFCASLALPALSLDAFTLFLALLVYGAMAGANDVAMNAQAVGTEKLLGVPAMSRFHAMFSFGGIAGACAGGLVASRGMPAPAHLAIAAVAFLIFVLPLPKLMAETRPSRNTVPPLRFHRIPAALLILSLIGFCIFLSEGAIADWTAVYLRQVLGASEGLAPAGYAVFSAAMAIFRFSGDAIVTRIGRVHVIRFGGLLAAAGMALVVSVHSPYWALAGFAAAGAGFSSIIPLVFAAGGRVPSLSEGAGVATVSGIGYLGFLVGPPAIGFISEMTSLRAGLVVIVVLSATAALLAGVVGKGDAHVRRPLRTSPGR
jgi:MFS family permease